jgi:enoyl-CoA hydratase
VNAVDLEVIDDFLAMVARLAEDRSMRAVVLTGTGTRFCAGADVAMMRDLSEANHRKVRRWVEVQAGLEALPKPVIAAINGYALGGGAELALAADVRLMAAGARIGFPEIELGLFPGAGGTQRLARLLGPARALVLMMEGRRLGADESARLGLVDRVLPDATLLPEAQAYARLLAARPTRAIGLLKRAVYGGWGRPLADGLAEEARAVFELIGTADAREGLTAFLEKRPPRFTGS